MDRRGYCLSKRTLRFTELRNEPIADVDLQTRRAYISCIVMVCDDHRIQPYLPQVILCSDKYLTAELYNDVKDTLGTYYFLVREKSSWNSQALLTELVRLLTFALLPFRHDIFPILVLDAAKQHLERRFIVACQYYGLALVVLAASMTWLLQPLDTHVFHGFKLRLRKNICRARMELGVAMLPMRVFIRVLKDTLETTLRLQNWAVVFRETGFSENQRGVSEHVLRNLGQPSLLPLAPGPPTRDQIASVLPADMPTNPNILFRIGIPRSQEDLLDRMLFERHLAVGLSHMITHSRSSHTWVSRTRLSRKRSLAQVTYGVEDPDPALPQPWSPPPPPWPQTQSPPPPPSLPPAPGPTAAPSSPPPAPAASSGLPAPAGG